MSDAYKKLKWISPKRGKDTYPTTAPKKNTKRTHKKTDF